MLEGLKGVSQMGASGLMGSDSRVTLLWLVNYVQTRVDKLSKSKQRPVARIHGDIGSFCIYTR